MQIKFPNQGAAEFFNANNDGYTLVYTNASGDFILEGFPDSGSGFALINTNSGYLEIKNDDSKYKTHLGLNSLDFYYKNTGILSIINNLGIPTISGLILASSTVASGSDGNVQFNRNNLLSGNSNLNFDYVNNRLGIGTGIPISPLHVYGGGNFIQQVIQSSDTTAGLKFINSSGQAFEIQNTTANPKDGFILYDRTNSSYRIIILNDGRIGLGIQGDTNISSQLHLKSGSSISGNSPLKINSGSLLTNPENGAIEFGSGHLYVTVGSVRYQLDQQIGTIGINSRPPKRSVLTTSANYSMNTGDVYSVIMASGVPQQIFITAPDLTLVSGYDFTVKKINNTTGIINITGFSATQLIDGELTYQIVTYKDSVNFISNGIGWIVI